MESNPVPKVKGGENLYGYVGNSPVNYQDPLGLICMCPFRGSTGMLSIDCSCKGRPIAIIPETGNAISEPACGIQYEADGFQVNSDVYKVDGSTCNTIFCMEDSILIESCINYAGSCVKELKPPYRVPIDEFGKTRRLPDDQQSGPVR